MGIGRVDPIDPTRHGPLQKIRHPRQVSNLRMWKRAQARDQHIEHGPENSATLVLELLIQVELSLSVETGSSVRTIERSARSPLVRKSPIPFSAIGRAAVKSISSLSV